MDSAIRHAIAPRPKKSFTCFQAVLCRSCDAFHSARPPFCEDFLPLVVFVPVRTRHPANCLPNSVCIEHYQTFTLIQGAMVHGSWNGGLLIHQRTPCPNFSLKVRRSKRLNCSIGLPIGRRPVVRSFVPRKRPSCFPFPGTEHRSRINRLRLDALLS